MLSNFTTWEPLIIISELGLYLQALTNAAILRQYKACCQIIMLSVHTLLKLRRNQDLSEISIMGPYSILINWVSRGIP